MGIFDIAPSGKAYAFFHYQTDASFERLSRGIQEIANGLAPDANPQRLLVDLTPTPKFASSDSFLAQRRQESLEKKIPMVITATRLHASNKNTADRLAETLNELYMGSDRYRPGDNITAHIYYQDDHSRRYVERE